MRTRIITVDGVPQQQIDAIMECDLSIIKLMEGSPANVETEARRLGQEFLNEKIDISAGPLFAAKLLRLSCHEHVLIVAIDHMVSDAISCDIMSKEIWELYNEASQGLPSSLPQLPVQFADYAVWQQQTYGAWFRKCGQYWRERLAGAPHLQLPFDGSLAEGRCATQTVRPIPFGRALSLKLQNMAARERTLVPLIVLAVYIAVVSRWCSQRDLVLSFVSHGRHRPELKRIVGWLANYQHMRIEIAEDDSFLDLLRRVDQEFHSARQHEDFDRVPDLIPGYTAPLYFNWLPATSSGRRADERVECGIKMRPFLMNPVLSREMESPSPELMAMSSDTSAGIVITVIYRSDLFKPRTIERLGDDLRVLAEKSLENPSFRIAGLIGVS
jgi:hypothetical protein